MRRRTFLRGAGAALTAAAIAPRGSRGAPGSPSERIRVGVAGVHGRGNNLLRTFAAAGGVEVAWIADVDQRVLGRRTEETRRDGRHRPEGTKDFRRIIDDDGVDAVVLGTPDHWHAIPAILACQAGKDVYVEKPDGHNVVESLRMAAAQRAHGRVVQLGTQARSAPHFHDAMEYLRSGAIGKVRYATAWESARQGSLGHPADSEPPEGVDYDFWLGPAPERPFNRVRFHSNWRWFFDYGTGDLGNDGVHRIDYARWGLESALAAEGRSLPRYPESVAAQGGKLYFEDCQEWPDTLLATFDYGGCLLSYELRIWTPYPLHGATEGAMVYGDQGKVLLTGGGWKAFGPGDEPVREEGGGTNLDQTALHVEDFLERMRSRTRCHADLETVGHPSSLLCHLGNAAWRAGRTLRFDPERESSGDPEADRYLTRPAYREPWTLPEV